MLQQQQQQRVQQKQRWRCDICHILTFETYQDACDHEEHCKQNIQTTPVTTTTNDCTLLETKNTIPLELGFVSSSSNASAIKEQMIPSSLKNESSNTQDSIIKRNRQRKQRELFQPTISVVSTTKTSTKTKQSQPKLLSSNRIKSQKLQQLSLSSRENSMAPLTHQLKKVRVSVAIEKDELQVFETLVPDNFKVKSRSRNKRLREDDILDTITSSSSSVKFLKKETTKVINTKKKKITNCSSITKANTIQKTIKNRSKKIIDSSKTESSNQSNTLMDWLAVTIPEEDVTVDDQRIIEIDIDTNDTKNKEQRATKFITEQMVAYQFREERRQKLLQEQEKRNRQKQRQEHESFIKRNNHDNITQNNNEIQLSSNEIHQRNVMNPFFHTKSNNTSTKHTNTNRCSTNTTTGTSIHAIRFPKYNHVISESNPMIFQNGIEMSLPVLSFINNQQKHWWNQTSDMRQHHVRTLPSNVQQQQQLASSTTTSVKTNNDNITVRDPKNGSFDLLSLAIQRYIIPSSSAINDDKHRSKCKTDSTLWVDRYYCSANINPSILDKTNINECITNSYCAASSQRTAYKQIHTFIERFMLERHKVNQIQIEKHNKQRRKFYDISSPPTNRKLKNTSTKVRNNIKRSTNDNYSDDDFLWVDDDDDETSESGTCTSTSLCVLSGPIGCGKSNLIHHIAKQLGCRKVVELHTGMKRNSASIKRYIEEATKSHSTFDMLHNQQQQKKSNIFTKSTNGNQRNDSNHENDDESSDERGSAVTVILIDEVDNLDPSTDTGFWPALCDLYKQSKCPIILTCNTIPRELSSGSSFQYTHVPMNRPTPEECSEQLQNILSREGFTVRSEPKDTHCTIDPLITIAEIGHCDMRRIIHELQLFQIRTFSSMIQAIPTQLLEPNNSKHCTATVIDSQFPTFQLPRIESTYPNVIYLDRYTSITITGSNFSSLIDPTNHDHSNTFYGYHCDVYIGDVRCPHGRIMNDTTIIAIIAPLHSTFGVDQRHTTKYLPVNVCCSKQLGLLFTTRTSITSIDLPDQTKIYSTTGPYLVECHFIDSVSKLNDDFENNLDNILTTSVITSIDNEDSAAQIESLPTNDVYSNIISKLLNTSVDDWIMKYGNVQKIEKTKEAFEVRSDDLQLLDDMCLQASRASDASLFEDIGLNFVPTVSGACRGFGFTYTDDYPKRTNENSKPPSEEQLILSGWKDNSNFYGTCDSFIVPCTSYRERELLRFNECSIRGRSPQYSAAILDIDDVPLELSLFYSEMSEEDGLHTIDVPTSLHCLPSLLNPTLSSYNIALEGEQHKRNKESKHMAILCVLREYIFTQPKNIQYLGRLESMSVDLHPTLNQINMLDYGILLDYLPLLRCMAIHEQISDCIHHIHCQVDSNETGIPNVTKRKPNTRQSKKLGREQYFDKIIPVHCVQNSMQTVKDIAAQLANMSLLFQREFHTKVK